MAFATTGIPSIAWLGLTCAAVVTADYLFVVVLVPVLMSFGMSPSQAAQWRRTTRLGRVAARVLALVPGRRPGAEPRPSPLDRLMKGIASLAIRRRGLLVVLSVIIVLGLAPGVADLKVNMDIFRFMGTRIPYVARVWEVVNSQLGSYLAYNITLEFPEPDAIKDPRVLRQFDALLDTVGTFPLTKSHKEAASVFSVLDIIKEMNQTLNNDDPAYYTVPDSPELVAQLLLLYEISGGTKTLRWIDEDYSMMRARVQVWQFDAVEIVRELGIIEQFGKTHFPDAKLSIVGSAVQFAELNQKIVSGEIKSILTALVVIGVLLVLVFGGLKMGLIGMVPNLMPMIAIAGYMGYFNSQLDMMTMTIMPMLLGVAVDDTIHFINQVKFEFERCGRYAQAVHAAFATVGKNLAMTTIILGGTFGIYTLSPMSGMVRIGMLAAGGLFVALITDYLATPALIMLTKPFGKERS